MAERRELARGRAAPERRQDPGGGGGEDGGQGTVSPLDMGRELAGELGRRNRRQAAPLAVIAGVYGLGLISAALAMPAALAPIGVGLAAAVAGSTLAARRAVTTGGRAYAGAAGTAAAGWLAASAVIGPFGPMTWSAWLGGYVLAVPYWARNSDPDPDTAAEREAPAPAPGPEPPPAPDWRAARWTSYLGSHDGSKLTDITEFAHGWRATWNGQRGQHWLDLTGRLGEIASVYDLEDGRVLPPEPIPGASVHEARLTVLTRNPLQETVHWPGPGLDPSRGTFPIARTADGQTLNWRLWWPGGGGVHGMLAGTTGSGKSAALDLILCEVAASDRLVPVIIDGNGGMSVPDWLQHAPYTATSYDEALELVRWVESIRQARSERYAHQSWTDRKGRARRGARSIDPTPEVPGIVLVIDEAHFLLDTKAKLLRLLEDLAKMGRKTAISIILVTQHPSVSELGGSSVLRGLIRTGTVIGFRTDKTSSGMITNAPMPEGLDRLPQEFPNGDPTQGLCYVLTQRLIRSRTWLVDDPYDYAELLPRKPLDGPPPPPVVPAPAPAPGLQVVTGGPEPDPDTEAQVRAALQAGVPPDAAAVMENTGLTLSQAKQALSRLN